MKRLVYYILWVTGIIGIYLFSKYIESYSLNLFYFIIGSSSIIGAMLIEKFVGTLYSEYIYFSFSKFFSVSNSEKIKLSNVLVLLGSPFIIVPFVGLVIM